MAETNDIRRAKTYYYQYRVVRNVPAPPWQTSVGTAVIHTLPNTEIESGSSG